MVVLADEIVRCMKQNILSPATGASVVARVQLLQSESKALWGSMRCTDMLRHCNQAMKATLETDNNGRADSLKQKILRFLFLNVITTYPKYVKAPRWLQVAGTVSADAFGFEKSQFIYYVNEFGNKKNIALSHPVFGRLNTRQWGIITWMHLDHHLRQFGV